MDRYYTTSKHHTAMVQYEDGDWVRYRDVQDLETEIIELKRINQELKTEIIELKRINQELYDECHLEELEPEEIILSWKLKWRIRWRIKLRLFLALLGIIKWREWRYDDD